MEKFLQGYLLNRLTPMMDADGGAAGDPGGEPDKGGSGGGKPDGGEGKTYTEAEIAELLQAEADRRVTAALKKQKREYEEKLSLSKLDEEQRKEAEKDLEIKRLNERISEMSTSINKGEVIKVLAARGLDPAFADIITIGDDIKEAQARIDTLDKLFKQAVEATVKKRIAGDAPAKGSGTGMPTTLKGMNVQQRAELYESNPELFRKLKGAE